MRDLKYKFSPYSYKKRWQRRRTNMARMTKNKASVVKMTELAILTAIVLILGIGIRLPFLATQISLVLIPIVLGATVLGPKAGAWLGLVFGLEVYIVLGVMGLDPFTMILFNDHPIITFLICTVKSTLAGFLSGLVYKQLSRLNELLATFVAAALTPLVNTGVFVLGCLLITDTLKSNFISGDTTVIYFLIIGCAGINFVFEFLINMVFAPSLNRVILVLNKQLGLNKTKRVSTKKAEEKESVEQGEAKENKAEENE